MIKVIYSFMMIRSRKILINKYGKPFGTVLEYVQKKSY